MLLPDLLRQLAQFESVKKSKSLERRSLGFGAGGGDRSEDRLGVWTTESRIEVLLERGVGVVMPDKSDLGSICGVAGASSVVCGCSLGSDSAVGSFGWAIVLSEAGFPSTRVSEVPS